MLQHHGEPPRAQNRCTAHGRIPLLEVLVAGFRLFCDEQLRYKQGIWGTSMFRTILVPVGEYS